jgi:hypothetical protein
MATFGPFQRADMMSVPREDMKVPPTVFWIELEIGDEGARIVLHDCYKKRARNVAKFELGNTHGSMP